jgi:hypothetical protein
MAGTILQHRRGTHSEVVAATPALGELFVDLTQKRFVIGDGVTPGGTPQAKVADFVDLAPTWGGTAGGTANAITVTLSPAPSAKVVGRRIRCIVATTNSGAATLNENVLGASSIRKGISGADALAAGDLVAGRIADFVWDGTYYRLLSPALPTVVSLTPGAGAGLQLPTSPAGSYWKYEAKQFDTTSGAFAGAALAGVAAASTILDAGTGGRAWICSAERVA